MTGVKLAALGLLVSLLTLILKSSGFSGERVFALAGTVAILTLCSGGLGSLLAAVLGISGESTAEDAAVIMKIVGAGYVFGICSDACSELGEGGVARAVSLAGRIEILTLALPYIQRIFRLGASLLSG